MQHVDILPYVCSFCAASTQQPTVLLAVDCLVRLDILYTFLASANRLSTQNPFLSWQHPLGMFCFPLF
jgi:hypothetical protein